MLRVISAVSGKEVRSHLALASSIQNIEYLALSMCVCLCAAGLLLRLQCVCGGSECWWFVRSVSWRSHGNGRHQGGGTSPCVHQPGGAQNSEYNFTFNFYCPWGEISCGTINLGVCRANMADITIKFCCQLLWPSSSIYYILIVSFILIVKYAVSAVGIQPDQYISIYFTVLTGNNTRLVLTHIHQTVTQMLRWHCLLYFTVSKTFFLKI